MPIVAGGRTRKGGRPGTSDPDRFRAFASAADAAIELQEREAEAHYPATPSEWIARMRREYAAGQATGNGKRPGQAGAEAVALARRLGVVK